MRPPAQPHPSPKESKPAAGRKEARPPAIDKKRLVSDNLAYVRAIAARVKDQLPREIEFDDLVAYGTQGLLEAAERYDGRHGASFTTFAYYRVRGAIFDGLRGMGWLPRGEYARARFEERAAAYLQNLSDRDMGEARFREGGRALEDDVRDLADALGGVAAVFVASLELEDEQSLPDGAPPPQERLEQREVERTLRSALGQLPDKERRLIELYYFEEKTLEEAGGALGLSKSWASRLHARAIELLKVGLERVQEPRASQPPEAPSRAPSVSAQALAAGGRAVEGPRETEPRRRRPPPRRR